MHACNLSLPCRFPRYIRSREDKQPEDASGPDVIVDLYNKQTRKMSSAKEMLAAQTRRERAEDAAQEVNNATTINLKQWL